MTENKLQKVMKLVKEYEHKGMSKKDAMKRAWKMCR